MTGRESLNGKPYAGTPHVRFDKREDTLATSPSRWSRLYMSVSQRVKHKSLQVLKAATVFAFASTSVAQALDTSLNDDFWDTRSYVNPAPSVVSGMLDASVDAAAVTSRASEALDCFYSTRPFFFIIVR